MIYLDDVNQPIPYHESRCSRSPNVDTSLDSEHAAMMSVEPTHQHYERNSSETHLCEKQQRTRHGVNQLS
jgi:hypothetical protein